MTNFLSSPRLLTNCFYILSDGMLTRVLCQVAATQSVCGSLSNPLLVLPVQAMAPDIPSPFCAKSSESMNPIHNNIIGAGFHDYEASILKKLQKV